MGGVVVWKNSVHYVFNVGGDFAQLVCFVVGWPWNLIKYQIIAFCGIDPPFQYALYAVNFRLQVHRKELVAGDCADPLHHPLEMVGDSVDVALYLGCMHAIFSPDAELQLSRVLVRLKRLGVASHIFRECLDQDLGFYQEISVCSFAEFVEGMVGCIGAGFDCYLPVNVPLNLKQADGDHNGDYRSDKALPCVEPHRKSVFRCAHSPKSKAKDDEYRNANAHQYRDWFLHFFVLVLAQHCRGKILLCVRAALEGKSKFVHVGISFLLGVPRVFFQPIRVSSKTATVGGVA
ncbi:MULTISPECIES: hypothetical protein [Thalassospira]|uniref:hypothetical protein n=1 Tax=Thalassospira TaxID=168934 RepID=UPI00082781DA|nr:MULTISPECIES: hypothetical protein [Thalassospira]OCK08646.1 hypothetical protein KO164_2825 [Thalassospira sp. KO164]SEE54117.1 hypothetical protein SAMN04515623_2854 [Thalassospira permensis]